jgi:hypothetical protein
LSTLAIGLENASKQGRRKFKMQTRLKVLAVALIAGGAMFAQPRLSIGVGVGGYGPGYQPSAYAQYMPPCPGPDYAWIDGYWVPRGGRNVWINGYWRSPYVGGYRVAPRYAGPGHYSSDRGNDRIYGNRYQNRGGERSGNRGRGYSNGFRR